MPAPQYAKFMLRKGNTAAWFYAHVIWTDICNSNLPRSLQKSNQQVLATKGKNGWISPGSEGYDRNLASNKSTLKQNSWDTLRIYWCPILFRGKLHIEIFDETFPGETEEGAARVVEKVRAAVNIRCQAAASKPNIISVDRGRGFYNPGHGQITAPFKQALQDNGLTGIMGDNASKQPGAMADMMLHETAVAWVRYRLAATTPKENWRETREEYSTRLKRCCERVNQECDVEGLCRQYPKRLKLLHDKEGCRLKY